MTRATRLLVGLALATTASCGNGNGGGGGGVGGSPAQKRGVGSECTSQKDCTEQGQQCLQQFKGGYCGIEDCKADADCPEGSACVTHDDGVNYCFLVCTDKPQCNINRSVEYEANCSSNVVFVEDKKGSKACVPPSSGSAIDASAGGG
ncbi:MAG: hypothetical protein HY744_28800 [Deltaproteobacteria bacterium]|nr:hypothetical protein [Deltaproteobacteria bacterium]